MFEHFTFGAQAQKNYDEEISASPTDTTFPSPIEAPPQCISDPWESRGINDIVNQFNNHSLTRDSEEPQQSLWPDSQPISPDLDPDPFTEEELSYVSTTRGMARVHHTTRSMPNSPLIAPSPNGAVACKRLQRQLNVQLQSCSNHMRDINALVEDMIVSNSQCRLHKSTSRPYLSSPPPSRHGSDDPVFDSTELETRPIVPVHEDEGFGDCDDAAALAKEEVSLRRASTPSGIRKYSGLKYKSSSEFVGGNTGLAANGRLKVRCVPRMRKRKVVRVPK